MGIRKRTALAALFFAGVLAMGAGLNPEEEFRLILNWEKPEPYPPPMIEGMDHDTLDVLLNAGNLQWYEPRPEKDKWEAVVGLKIHAPPEKVWEVITDYPALCDIMPLTYLSCETEYRKGNEVKNNQKGQTTVLKFAYKYDIIDIVTEDPPYHLHVLTIDGLDNRELDMILLPADDGKSTLFFMRYYLNMAALGVSMQAVLKVLPMVEPPTAVGAANYHSRAYKNEAEKRVGYKPPPQPEELKIDKLDLKTLRRIDEMGGGLIRETPEGKIIDALTYKFIDAPPDIVYQVMTDFDHYEEIFPGSKCTVEERTEDSVLLYQTTSSFSILIFSFGYDLHSRYDLKPPYEMTYRAIDGKYEGSHGRFRILPLEGGKKSLLFHNAGVSLEKDTSLTARIMKSGAFPAENMLNMMGAQAALVRIRLEAEKRSKGE